MKKDVECWVPSEGPVWLVRRNADTFTFLSEDGEDLHTVSKDHFKGLVVINCANLVTEIPIRITYSSIWED